METDGNRLADVLGLGGHRLFRIPGIDAVWELDSQGWVYDKERGTVMPTEFLYDLVNGRLRAEPLRRVLPKLTQREKDLMRLMGAGFVTSDSSASICLLWSAPPHYVEGEGWRSREGQSAYIGCCSNCFFPSLGAGECAEL